MKKILFITTGLLLINVFVSSAQDTLDLDSVEWDTTFMPYVEYDEETGNYIIYYLRDENTGQLFESLYVPPTKIQPRIGFHFNSEGDSLEYKYLLINGDRGKQRIMSMDMQVKERFTRISLPENWFFSDYSTIPYIQIVHKKKNVPSWDPEKPIEFDSDIALGDTLSFIVKSKYLPGIINTYVKGRPEKLSFSFITTPPREVYFIRDSLTTQVASDKGVNVKTVGPKFDPDGVTIDAYLDTLSAYVGKSCILSWIENRGICQSLEAKLDNTSRQLERGNTRPAAGSLQAFLNELNALKEEEQISSEAYALLFYNGEFLLDKLEE